MTIEILSYWIAVVVGLASLVALAWSAVRYVRVRQAEIHQRRFENIQKLMELYANWSIAGTPTPGPLAPQLAATFEFRNYPEYLQLFRILLAKHKFEGSNADLVNEQLAASIEFLARRRWWRPWKI